MLSTQSLNQSPYFSPAFDSIDFFSENLPELISEIKWDPPRCEFLADRWKLDLQFTFSLNCPADLKNEKDLLPWIGNHRKFVEPDEKEFVIEKETVELTESQLSSDLKVTYKISFSIGQCNTISFKLLNQDFVITLEPYPAYEDSFDSDYGATPDNPIELSQSPPSSEVFNEVFSYQLRPASPLSSPSADLAGRVKKNPGKKRFKSKFSLTTPSIKSPQQEWQNPSKSQGLQQLKNSLKNKIDELTIERNRLEKAEEAIRAFTQANEAYFFSHASLSAENQQLRSEIDRLKESLKRSWDEKSELARKNAELTVNHSHFEMVTANENLTTENRVLREENRTLTKNNLTLIAKNKALGEENVELIQNISKVKNENNQLLESFRSLYDQNVKLINSKS